MKNILVPTDFSACATYATEVAFELAAVHKACIHLYTRIDIPEKWHNMSDMEKEANSEALQNTRNIEVLLNDWKRKANAQGIAMKMYYSGGKFLKNVEQYVEEQEIDFIVMGSYGTSGKSDYFIGSNTQKVIRMVHCPVLVIKNRPDQKPIKKVVFASNFIEKEKRAFQYLLDFIAPLKPEIHLLEVNTSSWFGQPYILVKSAMEDFKEMCKPLTCKTHFYKDWSVDAGIRNFSEEIGADLIAISNQVRSPLKRILSGSNVEALVNHAELPVLSIDFPDKH